MRNSKRARNKVETMNSKVCGNCNAWERLKPDQPTGVCRRNPPTPVGLGMLPVPPPNGLMKPNQPPTLQPVVMNFCPETLETMWCRDGWQPLDETVIEGDRSPVDFSKLHLEGTA